VRGLSATSGQSQDEVTVPAAIKIISCGASSYYTNGVCAFRGTRGLNVVVSDPRTGAVLQPIKAFDTWGSPGLAHTNFINYVNSVQDGNVVAVFTSDEAGLNGWNSCAFYDTPEVQNTIKVIKTLGSKHIDELCYQGFFALIALKGMSVSLAEGVDNTKVLTVIYQHPFNITIKRPHLFVMDSHSPPNRIMRVLNQPSLESNVESSDDLVHWGVFETVPPTADGVFDAAMPIIENTAAGLPKSFYRVVAVYP